jgi:pyruvate dehydrogenase E2 component (dihydrolipoamide acetyltransferase)
VSAAPFLGQIELRTQILTGGFVTEIVMPKLGLTMTEGLIAAWHVGPGSEFTAGDILFVVETDKIANEIEASTSGTIEQIVVAAGETVPVGTVIARMVTTSPSRATDTPSRLIPKPPHEPRPEPAFPTSQSPERDERPLRVLVTPWARKRAKELNLDISALECPAEKDRITAKDVEQAALTANTRSEPVDPLAKSRPADRRRLAQALLRAKQEVPHFYIFAQADITEAYKLRDAFNNLQPSTNRVSVSHLLLKAIGLALKAVPEVNCIWAENSVQRLIASDVGIVADTLVGPVVPIIRNVGDRSLTSIAAEVKDKVARARSGLLTFGDIDGGAISLSNVGLHNVVGLIPIINLPQSMILGVGRARSEFRPGLRQVPELRQELALSLACDHRATDGVPAARFLETLVAVLEKPANLFK